MVVTFRGSSQDRLRERCFQKASPSISKGRQQEAPPFDDHPLFKDLKQQQAQEARIATKDVY
jgi:hypothetical protein